MKNQRNLNLPLGPEEIVFFDLESTGIGSYRSVGQEIPLEKRRNLKPTQPLQFDVGIYSIGYKSLKDAPTELWGITDIPLEEGAKDIYELNKANVLKYGKEGERAMLDKFITSLEDLSKGGKDVILSGYNIENYDVPLLIKRARQLGVSEEKIAFIRKLKVRDVKTPIEKLLRSLPEDLKAAIGIEEGKEIYGTKLKHIAAGFGIRTPDTHIGGQDAEYTSQIYRKLKGGERFDAFLWQRSVEEDGQHLRKPPSERPESLRKELMRSDPPIVQIAAGGKPEALDEIAKQKGEDYLKIAAPSDLFAEDKAAFNYEQTPEPRQIKAGDISKPPETEAAPASMPPPGVEKQKIIHSATKVKEEAKEVFKKAAKTLSDKLLQKNVLIGGAAAAIIGGAYHFLKDDGGIDSNEHISASSLGKPPEEVRRATQGIKRDKNFYKNLSAKFEAAIPGEAIGQLIAEEYESTHPDFVGSEYEVEDKELGVKGFIDMVVREDGRLTPIEVKSVDSDELRSMRGPRPDHMAQANFYAHALNSERAYILYVNREDTKERTMFSVPYDPGSLISQVQQSRSYILESLIIPEGIRNSNSSMSSWHGFEAMKDHTSYDYPGGRSQMFTRSPVVPKHCNRSGTLNQAGRNNFTGIGRVRSSDNVHSTINPSRYMGY